MLTLEDNDYGYAETKRALAGLDGLEAQAGLFTPEQASKGAWHEFGTPTIPSRPWMSVAADSTLYQLVSVAERELGAVADGKTTGRQAMARLGAFEADAARDVITSGQVGGPALAPSTVVRKGHAQKLIDTGAMLRAIKSRVVKQGDGNG